MERSRRICVKGFEQKGYSFYPSILKELSLYFLCLGNQSNGGWKKSQNQGLLTHHEMYSENERSFLNWGHNKTK